MMVCTSKPAVADAGSPSRLGFLHLRIYTERSLGLRPWMPAKNNNLFVGCNAVAPNCYGHLEANLHCKCDNFIECLDTHRPGSSHIKESYGSVIND